MATDFPLVKDLVTGIAKPIAAPTTIDPSVLPSSTSVISKITNGISSVLVADSSTYISDEFEISLGDEVEIGLGATLELG